MTNKTNKQIFHLWGKDSPAKDMFKKSEKKRGGFTLIELIVVMAIIGVLVLLAAPRFFGQVEKADVVHIKNDVKIVEKVIDEYLITHDILPSDWAETTPILSKDLFDIKGEATFIEEGTYKVVAKTHNGGSNLSGKFYTNDKGKVYYEKDKTVEGPVEEPNQYSDVRYFKFADEVLVSFHPNGVDGDLGLLLDPVIPKTNNGVTITTIGESAFDSYNFEDGIKISSVVIPNTITIIDDYAFWGNAITSANISKNIAYGESVFSDNEIASITIEDGVTVIPSAIVRNNKITAVEIPTTVTIIKSSAFDNNFLTMVDIPANVTTIEYNAFSNNELTSATVLKNVTYGKKVFAGNKITSASIEDGVTIIPENVFEANSLTSVVIPSSVVTIDESAFFSNNLTTVIINNGVTMIGAYAFQNNKLTSLVIPGSVASIGMYAFRDNKLTSVQIPASVTELEQEAFFNNGPNGNSQSFYVLGANNWKLIGTATSWTR